MRVRREGAPCRTEMIPPHLVWTPSTRNYSKPFLVPTIEKIDIDLEQIFIIVHLVAFFTMQQWLTELLSFIHFRSLKQPNRVKLREDI